MSKTQHSPSFYASVTDAAQIEKIVDYSFERSEKSNVLAIHQTRPLIAYLINIQLTQKISKAWTSGTEPSHSPSSSTINGQNNSISNNLSIASSNADKTKTVSIRIIDYVTRQRCLAKGIYHARPADCVFTINSLICSQTDIIKLAIVDRLANVYLYDLSYFINDLTATRIAVIRGPAQDVSPHDSISLVWCPFVPCEDFDDGDGGLRLALATNSRIEIFAVDRLQGKTGELQRHELRGSYKCINDAHRSNIVSLSISPDCSTISAAALDNRVTFFSSDIDDVGQLCLHDWDANIKDKSSISKLFFLDEYPKLLEDNTMKFWGAAFIGTRSGLMLLVDLRTWTVYQKMSIHTEPLSGKNFDYRIDLTSRYVVAMNGNQCYVVQIEHDYAKPSSSSTSSTKGANQPEASSLDTSDINDILNYLAGHKNGTTPQKSLQRSISSGKKQSRSNSVSTTSSNGLPKIVRITRLGMHNPIYSFVIKLKSDDELEMFTISAFSLERYIINLNTINKDSVLDVPSPPIVAAPVAAPTTTLAAAPVAKATATALQEGLSEDSRLTAAPWMQMDKIVEALFTKLNSAFSQGLDEFLNDVKCEVNDLKLMLNSLSRDVKKLQQQVQETRQK